MTVEMNPNIVDMGCWKESDGIDLHPLNLWLSLVDAEYYEDSKEVERLQKLIKDRGIVFEKRELKP